MVVGKTVFAACLDGTVTALDLEGTPRWSASVGRHPVFADLVGDKQGVLVSTSDLFLHSLDPHTGSPRWRHSLLECSMDGDHRILADVVAGGGDYQSPPTVSHGMVCTGGADRRLISSGDSRGTRTRS